MPGTYEVTVRGGVEQLAKLGRDLKDAGASDLRREMLRAGQRTTKPVKAAIKAHALSDLPHGGGLNVWVASNLKISTQVRLTGNNVGVRFKTKHPGRRGLSDLPAINDGRVRIAEMTHCSRSACRRGSTSRRARRWASCRAANAAG